MIGNMPMEQRRAAVSMRFGLNKRQVEYLSPSFMDQLDRCKSDEARRLLLGVSEREPEGKGSH